MGCAACKENPAKPKRIHRNAPEVNTKDLPFSGKAISTVETPVPGTETNDDVYDKKIKAA
jgi:hypothetical protein